MYVVTGTKEVAKDDTDVLDNVGESRLTLVTSTPEVLASRRLVATATLRTRAQPAARGRPTEVRRGELGLHRDGATALSLLLWTQALLVVAVASVWLTGAGRVADLARDDAGARAVASARVRQLHPAASLHTLTPRLRRAPCIADRR